MRTKDEILHDAVHDITDETYRDTAHLWLCLRQFEILIDIRDIIRDAGKDLQEAIWNMPGKD